MNKIAFFNSVAIRIRHISTHYRQWLFLHTHMRHSRRHITIWITLLCLPAVSTTSFEMSYPDIPNAVTDTCRGHTRRWP